MHEIVQVVIGLGFLLLFSGAGFLTGLVVGVLKTKRKQEEFMKEECCYLCQEKWKHNNDWLNIDED